MRESTAEQIVYDIIKDLRSRAGLGDEWDQIDEDIHDEIVADWIEIVLSSSEI